MTFTDAYASYGSTTKPLGSLSHDYTTMWNCHGAPDTKLAYPGAINSAGNSFPAHFRSFGARHKASTCNVW
ncbi:hypothetical protein [Streptacidiphilus monticola]|uniref:Uncharacterized protein n=1 Tax=Streptacidiphilus monticola TaxID=2161674 RepID=A0ABW1G9D4_9ACTN